MRTAMRWLPAAVASLVNKTWLSTPACLVLLLVGLPGLARGTEPGPFTTSFTVDTTSDSTDLVPGDGLCEAPFTGDCTLRAAIMESNAVAGAGEIILPPGTYILSVPGVDEDGSATGDLDVGEDLVVRGGGRDATHVDGGGDDRVFDIQASANVHLLDLTLRNGAAVTSASALGGAIHNRGQLTLRRCVVSDSVANLAGGILNRRELTIEDCVVRDNQAQDLGFTNAFAGGLASTSSSASGTNVQATILDSAIVDNVAPRWGGAEFSNCDWALVENTTFSGNGAEQLRAFSCDLTLRHATIVDPGGEALNVDSFDGSHTLEFANTAVKGFPACSLGMLGVIHSGHNASNDFSCGFSAAGSIEGVDLGLDPLAPVADSHAHLLEAGSPLRDAASDSECLPTDQVGTLRPPASAECDVGAIEMPTTWTESYAFAWADQPTSALYEPHTFYSFNRTGGSPIQITRSAAGSYAVHFPAFAAISGGGNVQVSHYGGGGGYCNVSSWDADTVNVLCFDSSGMPSDEFFTVLFLKSPAGTTSTSYAWAHSPTDPSYTPSSSFSFNPAGGTITATRSSTGVYSMEWDGAGSLGTGGGHVQVTAYGSASRCKVENWGLDIVNVRCFDSTGSPADSRYTVFYLRPDVEHHALAFAWANDSSAASYTPFSSFAFSSALDITASRSEVGSYAMDFQGFQHQGIDGGHVQVTAYGSGDTRCGVSGWGSETVFVDCYDSAGTPIDSRYDVLFFRPLPEPGLGLMLAIGALGIGLLRVASSRAP